MEMHQVRYFLAVSKHLNFTRAADELRVAQPSLTRAIQKLEAELQGPLFRRERLNTHLTELGRMMLPHLQAAFAAAETAKTQARRLKMQAIGSLTIGVCTGSGVEAPAALLLAVLRKRANISLAVEVAPSAMVERSLLAGEYDAAVLTLAADVHERLDCHPLHDEELTVAIADGHRFAALASVPLDMLESEALISHSGYAFDEDMVQTMDSLGVNCVVGHRSNDLLWVVTLVRSGLGCAILPRALAREHGLTCRPIEGTTLRYRTVLATVAGRRHSLALSTLIQTVSAMSPC
ncbi:LysR family transcriptional regulator [Lichenihabitans psoromatis]|uniref:LysR family transcriptional regulator n=1 Tax=Lichenihabitans psoromatis TaxID=2528642 RepID=UPI001FE1EC6B|nr:LysR family transcriptional regulator [Lichenihabitans psoromatis]